MSLWLVGGVDPTGGAGLDRDEATAHRLAPSLPRLRFATATTRQGHGGPAEATPTPVAVLRAAFSDAATPRAIKVGLVPADVVGVVADALATHDVARVVDPVLAASDGGTMGADPRALGAVLRHATVLTPNRPEAARLLGHDADGPELVDALVAAYPHAWILLKDGHGRDPTQVRDVLARAHERHVFARPRRPGPDVRGTGCALATAIAVSLARGDDVPDAVATAIAWLDAARRHTHQGPDGRLHLS